MTHGSLFSGIGGFDLAAAWAGWTNVFNCEIDPFCRRVLKYHFPESEQINN
jgi:DNA (cytosine-5)-methyltransferase 1